MKFRVDLHNHSVLSHDGFIGLKDFARAHEQRKVDLIAITDHGDVRLAQAAQAQKCFPVIVGQEISTPQGEIIGLFLNERVPEPLDIKDAIRLIRQQNGLVYLPHPLLPLRAGASESVIDEIAGEIDLFEVANGRLSQLSLFKSRRTRLDAVAKKYGLIPVAASDAHQPYQLGRHIVEVDVSHISQLLRPQSLKQAIVAGKIITQPTPFISEIFFLASKELPKMIWRKTLHHLAG